MKKRVRCHPRFPHPLPKHKWSDQPSDVFLRLATKSFSRTDPCQIWGEDQTRFNTQIKAHSREVEKYKIIHGDDRHVIHPLRSPILPCKMSRDRKRSTSPAGAKRSLSDLRTGFPIQHIFPKTFVALRQGPVLR